MITVSNIAMPLDAFLPQNEAMLTHACAQALNILPESITSLRVSKRSIDARKKSDIHFVVSCDIELQPACLEEDLLACAKTLTGVQVRAYKPYQPLEYPQCSIARLNEAQRPVVVGAGPAGLFAGLYLARCGLQPLVIEQGAPVQQRIQDVNNCMQTGVLKPYSNIQFGEGGAGTFSDGKLTTNTKNPLTRHVLHWFVDAGAPDEILWHAHPHIGSDNLRSVVQTLRQMIIAEGGEVRFNTRCVGFEIQEHSHRICAVRLQDTNTQKSTKVETSAVIVACGHSARELFEVCRDTGLAMEQKPFSVGVRIEHPQALINQAQWGNVAHHPALGAAEYKMAVHLPSGRSVYTFCMCPGGTVVAAASEDGGVVTNGMSNFARAGANANAAVLVTVGPEDYPSTDVLAGVEFQRSIEQAAFEEVRKQGGAAYQAPAQRVGSFLESKGVQCPYNQTHHSTRQHSFCTPTYGRGIVEVPLAQVLPSYVAESLALALPQFDRKLKGFAHPDALLTAPETRSSSPVRILRDETMQAVWTNREGESGIYPCGEGPGYAGGIMSAAVDGIKVAQAVAQSYC